MPLFPFRRQRKIHHGLIFDQRSRYNSVTSYERMAMFVRTGSQISNSTNEANQNDSDNLHESPTNSECSLETNVSWKGENMAKRQRQQVVWDKEELRWKKKINPQEMAIRRRKVVETLNKRRGAVCSEIERGWFLEWTHLEKLRHNLQATHKLTERGLLVWW